MFPWKGDRKVSRKGRNVKEFLVGLLVILLTAILLIVGTLLLPLLLLLGVFLRFVLGLFLILFAVWLIGKVTLLLYERISRL